MLTVVSAKQKAIDISAEIIGSLNETDFRQGLLDYFQRLTQRIMTSGENRKSYYVSYAQISSIILVEGNIHMKEEIFLLKKYLFNFLRSPDYVTDVNFYLPKFPIKNN